MAVKILIFSFLLAVYFCKGEHEDTAEKDLDVYLCKLFQIIRHYEKCFQHFGVSAYFGLFLTHVNLKKALDDNGYKLNNSLQKDLKNKLNSLQNYIDLLMWKQVDNVKKYNVMTSVLQLTENKTEWIRGISNFGATFRSSVEDELPDWDTYERTFQNTSIGVPNGYLSDDCILSMSNSSILISRMQAQCVMDIPKECRHAVLDGTHFGYHLTHRLLQLILAKFSHNCSIFSREEDDFLIDKFCNSMLIEARWIYPFEPMTLDLIMEQVALCSLFGYGDFIKREWIYSAVRFNNIFHYNDREDNSLPPYDSHLAEVTAAALGSAVRYIVENI